MYDIQLVVRDHEVNTCTQLTVYENEFLRKCLSVSASIILYCMGNPLSFTVSVTLSSVTKACFSSGSRMSVYYHNIHVLLSFHIKMNLFSLYNKMHDHFSVHMSEMEFVSGVAEKKQKQTTLKPWGRTLHIITRLITY